MTRSRLVPALALATCLLASAAPGARAQAARQTLRVDIPVVEVSGRPGATSTDRVQLINDGPNEAQVNILITDVGGDSRGEPVAVPRGLGQANSAADWVSVRPSSVTVGSQASSIIDITIKVPPGTKAGGYYAAVTFAPDDRTPPEQRPSHILLVKIAGAAAVANARLSEFSMAGISLGGSVRFDLRLENIGTVHAIGTGRIAVRDQFGNLLTRLPIPSVVVLPGLERALSLTWKSPPVAAKLSATAEVSFGGSEPARQSASGFALMWWLAAMTLAVLMLLLVAILRLTGVITTSARRRAMPGPMPAEAVRAAPPLKPAPRPVRPVPPPKPEEAKGKKERIKPPPAPGPAMTRPPVVAGPVTAPPKPDPSFWGPSETDELKPAAPVGPAAEAEEIKVPERPAPPVVVYESSRGVVVVPPPGKEEAVTQEPTGTEEEGPLASLVLDEEQREAPETRVEEEPRAEDEEPEAEPLILDAEASAQGPSRPVPVTPSARPTPVMPKPAAEEVELVDLDLEDEAEEEEFEEIAAEEELEEPWFFEPEELEEEPEEGLPEPAAVDEPEEAEAEAEEPEEPEEEEEEPEELEEFEEEEPDEPVALAPIPETPLRPATRARRPVRVANLPPVRPRTPVPTARVESPPEPATDVPTAGGSAMALRRAEVALRMITGKPGETGAILDAGLDLLYTVRNDRAVVARVESEFRETRNKRKLGPLSLALFAVQSAGAPRALLESYGTAAKVVADRIRRAILACDPSDIRRHRSVIEEMPAARRASLGL